LGPFDGFNNLGLTRSLNQPASRAADAERGERGKPLIFCDMHRFKAIALCS
jgi:hypothetical protein